ncbi:hypothetical protein [Clostridium sp. JN-9]|uniref:hypothetical protein n=1 Tax=Clostridium sp. JN-9 TaxID=2507159 RepID=UPI000FFDF7F1|nr:hypothetical protein [Clostridium sp. JN-9]QAT39458.1 hypothetical protein EQM05_03895 [Clostridium sp. JN-9]
MGGKTYIYTITSFILLAFAILKNGFDTVIMCRFVLVLSVLIAIIGIVQIIRIWKNDNKILNALDSWLLLLNILLIIINSFWLWITTFKDGM